VRGKRKNEVYYRRGMEEEVEVVVVQRW